MAYRPSRKTDDRSAPDTTVYPVEEKVGEELLQRLIIELLRPLVARYLEKRGVLALTGADQFIYFRHGDTRGRVAPDLFILPGVRPARRIRSWKTWLEGVVPSFALEVVSTDVDKDYIDAPRLYGELGVKELLVFDPDYEESPDRYRFQVYRRIARRGLVRTTVTNDDHVASKVLGCFVRAVGSGETTRLRLAVGPEGETLIPTEAEEERRAKEQERAAKEQERAAKEQERAARIAAEAEVERLRALLRHLPEKPRRKS